MLGSLFHYFRPRNIKIKRYSVVGNITYYLYYKKKEQDYQLSGVNVYFNNTCKVDLDFTNEIKNYIYKNKDVLIKEGIIIADSNLSFVLSKTYNFEILFYDSRLDMYRDLRGFNNNNEEY